MIVKVKLEGELLEALKKDAEINLRTHPAQIIYYLRQIYADQIGAPAGATPAPSIAPIEQIKSPEDLTLVKEVPEVATIAPIEQAGEPLVPAGEPEDKTTGSGMHQEDIIDIPDDILNF